MATETTDSKTSASAPVYASRLDSYQTVPHLTQPQPASVQQDSKRPQQQWNPYIPATPPLSLHQAPALVDCPACGYRAITRVDPVSGNTTHAWGISLCFCCCLGCLPYLSSSLKDVDHYCGKCGVLLATWHNSGRVELAKRPKPQPQPQQSPLPQRTPSAQELPTELETSQGDGQETARVLVLSQEQGPETPSAPAVTQSANNPSHDKPDGPGDSVPDGQMGRYA